MSGEEGGVSLNGCFALDELGAPGTTQLTDTADWPVLYATRLLTRKPCKDLLDHVRALDRECWREKRDAAAAREKYEADLEEYRRNTQAIGSEYRAEYTGSDLESEQSRNTSEELLRQGEPKPPEPAPDCSTDDAIALIGEKICNGYEGSQGAWKDMYLAECDCLKRDHVPPLSQVVALCRQKLGQEQDARQAYEAAVAANELSSGVTPPAMTVSAEFCDKLERKEGVLMSAHRKSAAPFDHLLARYLIRTPWVEVLSAEAEDLHPSCLYKPCRNASDGIHHVSYPDLVEAAPCTNISLCEASINVQYASGSVSTFDNLFHVKCSGGSNCTGDTAHRSKCKNGGACQPDGSCLCPKRPREFTGPRCETEVKPDPNYRPPEEGQDEGEEEEDDPKPKPAPAPAKQEKASLAPLLFVGVPIALLLLVGLFLLLK